MTSIEYSVDDAVPDLPLDSIKKDVNVLLKDSIFRSFPANSVISVAFVHESLMKELNSKYRSVCQTTDVLTFPIHEKMESTYLVGEIILCVEEAKRDAATLDISLQHEYMWLFTHGFLHLLGYDHHTEEELKTMRKLENSLLKKLNPEWGGNY